MHCRCCWRLYLENDFGTQHFALMDLLEEQPVLDKEQEELDKHDDEVTALSL